MFRLLFFISVLITACGQKKTASSKEADQKTEIVSVKERIYDTANDSRLHSKRLTDSIFQQVKDSNHYSYQDAWATMMVGNLFSKNEHFAVVRYMPTDTTYQVFVFHQLENKYQDTILSAQITAPFMPAAFSEIITIKDYNGDGFPDLIVTKFFSLIHTYESSDLWLFENNRFKKVKGFDEISSAAYDPKTNLIYSYQSAGCADMLMNFGVYKIVKDSITIMNTVNCDCCNDQDSCSISVNSKTFKVPNGQAYQYVPTFYAVAVKEKCELAANSNP